MQLYDLKCHWPQLSVKNSFLSSKHMYIVSCSVYASSLELNKVVHVVEVIVPSRDGRFPQRLPSSYVLDHTCCIQPPPKPVGFSSWGVLSKNGSEQRYATLTWFVCFNKAWSVVLSAPVQSNACKIIERQVVIALPFLLVVNGDIKSESPVSFVHRSCF